MHEVLVNRLGGLGLPRKSVVRLTDRPDMTLDVYRGRKTTMQQQQQIPENGCTVPQWISIYIGICLSSHKVVCKGMHVCIKILCVQVS